MRGTLWRHWEYYRWIGCINPCITSWFLFFYLVTRQMQALLQVNLATLFLLDMWYLQFTLILTLQIIPDKLLFKITVDGCSFNWCHSRLSNFVWNITVFVCFEKKTYLVLSFHKFLLMDRDVKNALDISPNLLIVYKYIWMLKFPEQLWQQFVFTFFNGFCESSEDLTLRNKF